MFWIASKYFLHQIRITYFFIDQVEVIEEGNCADTKDNHGHTQPSAAASNKNRCASMYFVLLLLYSELNPPKPEKAWSKVLTID